MSTALQATEALQHVMSNRTLMPEGGNVLLPR
jgi:hypothetical protein